MALVSCINGIWAGVATGTTVGPSATLTHDSVNHEPVYFTLAFIMKS